MSETVEVHIDLDRDTVRVGTAFLHRRRRSLSTTFTYDPAWLSNSRSFPLDPRLGLTGGAHHVEGLPGSFSDGAPDRWGRNLLKRRARSQANRAGGTPPSLSEIDFLLGVGHL